MSKNSSIRIHKSKDVYEYMKYYGGLLMDKIYDVIVLGAAAKHMSFAKEEWVKVIETTVPPKTIAKNVEAFEAGYNMGV